LFYRFNFDVALRLSFAIHFKTKEEKMSFGGDFRFENEQETEVVQTTTTTTRYRVCLETNFLCKSPFN
jgi:hypothetical protein